jgi:hypothetical protein
MKFKYADQTLQGVHYLDIVKAMQSHSLFDQEKPMGVYMKEAAARGKMQSGKVIRSDTADNFVKDLVAAGLLEELK